jgi:xanthine dehydrogenase small subunit
MIRFLLNSAEHQLDNIDPNTTLLDYLREQLDLTGTKEGCASGDCGACTVVVAAPNNEGDKLEYLSVNACITLLASLHGKQLITVEHLQQQQLHPSQQAMVDCHGSQCGFCTPGFVMSLFAYGKNNQSPQRDSIITALGGNLCRCTGYRPIIDAAVQMYEPNADDQFEQNKHSTLNKLKLIKQSSEAITLATADRQFFAPTTSDQLAALLLEYPAARLVAGATDLALELTQGLRRIDTLIATGQINEMKTIVDSEQLLTIGAAASYSSAEPALVAAYPDLHELLDRLGSLQVRNQGTLGGNIGNASPIADIPPVLIALNASLILRKGAQRRTIAIEDFYISYKKTALQTAEFIEHIVIPKHSDNTLLKVYKISKRLEDDISASCAAIQLQCVDNVITSASIAYGGMAEIPKRACHCEQSLIGQPWSQASIQQAMIMLEQDFNPISDFRASADYRLTVSKNLLLRYFHEINAGSANTLRVTHYA